VTSVTPGAAELAYRYAQAIYKSALESWLRQLGTARQEWVAHPEVHDQLDSDAPFTERQRVLDVILPDQISEGVRNFLYVLLKERHLNLLDDVTVEFERLVRRGPAARVARVTSAVPLTDEERAQLRERLIQRFGGDLEFDFHVDSQILGGLIVKVGDEVIDGSLASKLAAMRAQLTP
jgi:F-type H+-transporting ATPase subunit delta